MIPQPYLNSDPHSFAYGTARVRWPKILQDCINALSAKSTAPILSPEIITSTKSDFESLLKQIDNDDEVPPFTQDEIKLNSELQSFNDELSKYNDNNGSPMTWKTGPWLYLECYLYQVINNFFLKRNVKNFDIFQNLKQSTLISSKLGIIELCKKINTFDFGSLKQNDDDKFIFFKEFIDISLWGNSTDLSLLAGDVTLEDIKSLQGEEIRKSNEKNILINNTKEIFNHLNSISRNDDHSKTNIDIVLDNSGFELFSDLVLSIFLIETKLCQGVTFHCKQIPWFVSDTLEKDFDELFSELSNFNDPDTTKFIDIVKGYLSNNTFKITSDPYWTLSTPFWNLSHYPIYHELKHSSLVIFKGDLNYRKLTGDVQWPKTTPFETALNELHGKINVVSLRTCKADVTVGLQSGVDEKLVKENGEFWSSSGKYAVICFDKQG